MEFLAPQSNETNKSGTGDNSYVFLSHTNFLTRVAASHINILDLSGSMNLELFSNPVGEI